MPRRSYEEDHYDYGDDEYEDKRRGDRRHRREKDSSGSDHERKKRWDRESYFDSDHDYDERR